MVLASLNSLIHHAQQFDVGRLVVFRLFQQQAHRLAGATDDDAGLPMIKPPAAVPPMMTISSGAALASTSIWPPSQHIAANGADDDGDDADNQIHEESRAFTRNKDEQAQRTMPQDLAPECRSVR